MGECLVQAELITEEDLRTALTEQKRTGERLGIVLTRLGLATETGIARALAVQLGFPYVDLSEHPPDPDALGVIPRATALKHAAVGVRLEKRVLIVAMSDPLLLGLAQDLERETGFTIRQVVATRSDILAAIVGADRTTPGPAGTGVQQETAPSPGSEAGVEDTLRSILSGAVSRGATDIHVEPTAQGVTVRERMDGVLRHAATLPAQEAAALIAALKRLAGMRVTETRLPQDGRLRCAVGDGSETEFRVSSLRTLFGEKVVLRRWDRPAAAPSLNDLGLSKTMLDEVRGFGAHRRGLVLIIGPAGSGVQATLAALAADVAALRSGRSDIVSIEDAIEYEIPGVTQTAVEGAGGEDGASRLRSILQQRPDVVVVGALREVETATLALSAAAGELVITTVRADDLPSGVSALVALGVDPATIAGTLVGVVVQRLVRRLCTSCRGTAVTSLDAAGAPGAEVSFEPVGCDECQHTGYRGRIGVYQTVVISGEVRQAIVSGNREERLADVVRRGGGVSLAEDALSKAQAGVTSMEEVLMAVGREDADRSRPLCTACGAAVDVGFLACPSCGTTIGGACGHCGRALQPGWRFCPYCASRAEPRSKGRDGNRGRARSVLS
jgi:type IV pilus assembly protein PilB